ncbi:MAG: dockerin type I domain-containing protein [Clostridiales bacterium]|nr:dockerin type I domain-containing protein [Clostridiales bacterium]
MKLKKIIGILAIVYGVFLCSVCANAAEIIVESRSATAGETVEISVSVKPSGEEAESMNGYAVQLTYDNTVLTPVVQGTDLLGEELYAVSGLIDGVFIAALADGYDNILAVSWADSTNFEISEETELFTVQFTIADEVSVDSTNIEISVVEYAYNSTELAEDDEITVTAGTITFNVEILRGDANGNGVVDIADAALISRYLAKLTDIDDENLENADANGNGAVDIADAALISRYLAKLADME